MFCLNRKYDPLRKADADGRVNTGSRAGVSDGSKWGESIDGADRDRSTGGAAGARDGTRSGTYGLPGSREGK
jgi:hypothetical protein